MIKIITIYQDVSEDQTADLDSANAVPLKMFYLAKMLLFLKHKIHAWERLEHSKSTWICLKHPEKSMLVLSVQSDYFFEFGCSC
jgi:hypothetical protein